MRMQSISVVVPAHNEAHYIARCLASIKAAASAIDVTVEIVVVLNRCADATETIAKPYAHLIVEEDAKNLARIRNRGVRASSGDVLVTIDADSRMSPNMLQEVLRRLRSGKYIGGGVRIMPERMSPGIFCSVMMILPYVLAARISAGLFWLYRRDFEAVGGFDEQFISAEDYHFARKLKKHGVRRGLKFGTILRAHIVTSCRKFDQFGDWYLVRHPRMIQSIFKGDNRKAADMFYYDTGR
jgi:glycosyltransferase involved in cell wall biosynthesis